MNSAFLKGLGASLSIALGYVPVAISFGLAAVYGGFPPAMAILVSLLVYAGASQFILVSLLAAGGTAASIVGIVWLMNLRHFFYGPALMSRLGPGKRRLPTAILAAGLTDEVFAASISKLEQQPEHERELWYAGLQLGAYAAWVGGTAVGALFGHDWIRESGILSHMLGFVLPALFFALLLEIRKLVATSVVAGAALITALSLMLLPVYGALIAGMLGGAWLAARRA